MDAPKRVWLDWPGANRGDPVFDEPPEHAMQPGQTLYILATPEALATSPEVAELVADAVAAERERCAQVAEQFGVTWEAVCMASNKGGVCDIACETCLALAETDPADSIAAAIRRAAEGTGT